MMACFAAGILFNYEANAQAGSVVLIPQTGTSTTYPSITLAYAAIPASPTMSYTIELLASYVGTDASEVYPIQLTDKGITPAGPITITIRPSAGSNTEVIKRPTAAAGSVLQFNGADNVILDGRPGGITSSFANYLTVSDAFSGSSTNRNIELLNSANSNTIQYVNSIAADATAASAGSRNILVGSTTTTGNNNNTIQFNNVVGGLRAIQDFGLSDAAPNLGTRILSNQVSNFGAIGIFAGSGQGNITIQNNNVFMNGYNVLPASTTAAVGVTAIQQQSTLASNAGNISNNTISINTTSTTITSLSGIVDIASGTETIFRNTISTLTAPMAQAITGVTNFIVGISVGTAAGGSVATHTVNNNYLSGMNSAGIVNFRGMSIFPFAGSTVNVHNNSLSITDANTNASAIFGMLLGNTAATNYNANVYYNSVRVGGTTTATTTNGYGIFKSDANAGSVMNIRNNIAVADRNQSIAFNLSSTAGILNIDYNNWSGAGTGASSFAAASPGPITYDNTQLAAYKAAVAPAEQNTTFSTVTFVSNTDLHLSGASTTDATLKAVPVAGITTDFDGNTRSVTTPTKGADEPGQPVPVQLFAFSGIVKEGVNQLNWSTASESNNKGFEVQRSANGTDFTPIAFIASKADNGQSTSVLSYSFNDVKPFKSNSYYRLKQVDKDGKFVFSTIVLLKGKGVQQLQIVNLYPNPVKENFNVVVASPAAAKVVITVSDMMGRIMMQQVASIAAGDNLVPVNSTRLNAGTYTVKIFDQQTGESVTMQMSK